MTERSDQTSTLTITLAELRESVDGLDIPEDRPTRVNVRTPGATAPLLIVRRGKGEQVIVLNNGAVDLQKSHREPVFQRSSWWREIEHHQIYVCDPQTVGPEALRLAWMQNSASAWIAEEIAEAVRLIAVELGANGPKDRTYFGSSAGGYAALVQLQWDPDASAIINNAQFDWTRWYSHQVQDVLDLHHPGENAQTLRRKRSGRTSALDNLAATDRSVKVDYYINLGSDYDRKIQLPIWQKFVIQHPEIAGQFTTHYYNDPTSGHNPLSKSDVISILAAPRKLDVELPHRSNITPSERPPEKTGGAMNRNSFDVKIAALGDEVRARVDVLNDITFSTSGTEYAFYLLKDQEIVSRTGYQDGNAIVFRPEDDGNYAVKAFISTPAGKIGVRSEVIRFTAPSPSAPAPDAAASPVAELEALLAAGGRDAGAAVTDPLPPLPYTPLDYPHDDYMVIQRDAQLPNTDFDDLLKDTGLKLSRWSSSPGYETLVLATPRQTKQNECPKFLFSGLTRTSDRFIFGRYDLQSQDTSQIDESIGDFSLVTFDGSSVHVSTDYFGISKIYYYSGNGISAVSNRYHLLILGLKASDVSLKLNRDKVLANIEANTQVFTQNFVHEMDIEGCFQLPSDRALVMNETRITAVESELARDLARRDLPRETYEASIRAAAAEVIDNLRIVLEHPRFDHVRVDLTGGMDARIIFAALTHLTDYRDKISIHTADSAATPEDLGISLMLTKACEFQYDVVPRVISPERLSDSLQQIQSIHLGGYYGHKPKSSVQEMPRTLRTNGFYGEITARPYYARLLFGRPLESAGARDYAVRHVSRIPRDRRPFSRAPQLEELFASALESLPGDSTAEIYDMHYLFFRNGYHCSDKWFNQTLAPGWGPLQSKLLFKLKHATFHEFKSIKVQLDITDELNINVSRLPYGRAKDNQQRSEMIASGALLKEGPDNSHLDFTHISSEDMARYSASESVRSKRTTRSRTADDQAIRADNAAFPEFWRILFYRSVIKFCDLVELDDYERAELCAYALEAAQSSGDLPDTRTNLLLNKLLSACHQADIITDAKAQANAITEDSEDQA